MRIDFEKNLIDLEYQEVMKDYQVWYTFITIGVLGFIGTAISLTEDLRVAGLVLTLVISVVSYIKLNTTRRKLRELRKKVRTLK